MDGGETGLNMMDITLLAASSSGEALTDRLFGLDMQLIADTCITALNVFVLFVLLSFLLFNPVRRLMKQRQEKIREELEAADEDKKEAVRYKAEYEDKLRNADQAADQILREAGSRAKEREEAILAQAKEEAEEIRERTKQELVLMEEAMKDKMHREMISVAAAMAGQVIASALKEEQDRLIEETMKEMSESTWKQ